MKQLIAYFSRADENYVNGKIAVLTQGNTQVVATFIHSITKADLFEIVPQEEYAKTYNECIAQAQQDLKTNARPKLKTVPESIDAFDEIYLGFPNYWGTMPMAVWTFLEQFNFDNKIIKPFCTHEGSGMGNSIADIKKLCKGAKIQPGLAIFGGSVQDAAAQVKQWL